MGKQERKRSSLELVCGREERVRTHSGRDTEVGKMQEARKAELSLLVAL